VAAQAGNVAAAGAEAGSGLLLGCLPAGAGDAYAFAFAVPSACAGAFAFTRPYAFAGASSCAYASA
jgi:hypothetical protein